MTQLSLNTHQRLGQRLGTAKTVRKIHMDLGRNGRGVIRSGPVPLGGDSEETEYMGGGPPWEDLCDPMDAAHQASLSSTISQSLLKFISIKWQTSVRRAQPFQSWWGHMTSSSSPKGTWTEGIGSHSVLRVRRSKCAFLLLSFLFHQLVIQRHLRTSIIGRFKVEIAWILHSMDRQKSPGKQPSIFLSQWNLKFSCDDSQHQSNKDNVSRVLLFSYSVMSSSLRPHGLQHARLPCPSLSPRVCSKSCPLSQWCHPTISSSVSPFSTCLQSVPASRSFPVIQLFTSGGQSIGGSVSASVLPIHTILGCFPLELTGLILWVQCLKGNMSKVELSISRTFLAHSWPPW